jgi:cytochrome b561
MKWPAFRQQARPKRMDDPATNSRLYDTASVYGWISILLHWTTAAIIIVLWFIGKSIMGLDSGDVDDRRALHVSIAASAWLLLVFRALWRFRSGHPHVRGQSAFIHRVARSAHYAMLAVVLLMLLSGPLLVWSRGQAITLFGGLSIPGPFAESESLSQAAWFLHSNAAMLLFWLVLLHIGGALKHLMFHTDDTVARMIWPGKSET